MKNTDKNNIDFKEEQPPMRTGTKIVKKGKKVKKKKRKKLIVILVIEVIVILLLIPAAWFIWQLSRIQTHKIDSSAIAINDFKDKNMEDYTNFVIFGVDSRDNELDKDTRSDSMIVVSINKKTHAIRLLSLYRDCFTDIEGHGLTKLTHAYAYGGPELAISTINRNFDLNISDFVTVNFSILTNVIDSLGGIKLNITEDEIEYVNAYTRDVARINGTKARRIKKAGKQRLDGTQATAYCRVRYTAGGDFTRAERQRKVIYAVMKKIKGASLPTLVKLVNEIMPQVYTSFSSGELTSLAIHAISYHIEKDSGFPFDKTTPTINEMSVVLPTTLESNVTKMHEFLFNTKDYEPSNTVKEISQKM